MTVGGAFLGGATGRLLPVSIPLRFFGAAAAFHVAAWAALVVAATDLLTFRGGLGWPLAALHLFTLGVFGMTALGAGAQLLPVATRQEPVRGGWLAAIWYSYTPAVAVLATGMGLAQPALIAIGGCVVTVALIAWAALVAQHVLRTRGMPGVIAHAWGALASLVILLASALLLAAGWLGLPAPSRQWVLPVHLVFAPFGFMGMLSIGLAYILVPMFAVATPPRDSSQLTSAGLLAAGLLLAAAALAFPQYTLLRAVAWATGATGVALHLKLMHTVLREGLRTDPGPFIKLVKFGWVALVATLLLAAALWTGAPLPRLEAWFALALLAWLLSIVLGFLQRILPFLAALHAAAGRRRGPTASTLSDPRALKVHLHSHFAALALLAGAIAFGSPGLARIGAVVGLAGAASFAVFYLHLLQRLRAAAAVPSQAKESPT